MYPCSLLAVAAHGIQCVGTNSCNFNFYSPSPHNQLPTEG